MRILACTVLWFGVFTQAVAAQLSSDWMLSATANTRGERGTYWRSDVSLHNPHDYDLPVVVQLLPTNTENWEVSTVWLTLYPYETLNLWDVLGPDLFDHNGTGAMLVYADYELPCDPITDCDFLVTSRTYTVDPRGSTGEFGQTIPGVDVWSGIDWETFGYAAGILNDDEAFRCNFGMASWTPDWTSVRVDVQDAEGNVVATHTVQVPPYGHVQRRLPTAVFGGSLVFYLVEGPTDARIFPYASVVDQTTGDASYVPGVASVVGATAAKTTTIGRTRPHHPRAVPAGKRVAVESADLRSRSR
jgi:hypothetical protein